MSTKYLPAKNTLTGHNINSWQLMQEIGRGRNGVVYQARRPVTAALTDTAAIKLIPNDNLRNGWEVEINKAVLLDNIEQIVKYRHHEQTTIDGTTYAAIFWQFVSGRNLRDYITTFPLNVTISFVETVIKQTLRAFLAMETIGISHGDLHEGNIMVADPTAASYERSPTIKLTDFGIGCSMNNLIPKDDYTQLASICHSLLEVIDPATLTSPGDKERYSYLLSEFLPKNVLERDPSVGPFVRKPRQLLDMIERPANPTPSSVSEPELRNPFDYLSCEQMGDSFHLLHTLYSSNFPGYDELLQKANTILTGPRGCGKTTIFRNLSLKAQLLSGAKYLTDLGEYVGVYYHCGDLYFPFQYLRDRASESDKRVLIHFFNLALLRELLETMLIAQREPTGQLDDHALLELQSFLRESLRSYSFAPQGTDVLSHLLSVVESEKHKVGSWLQRSKRDVLPDPLSPTDFIPKVCDKLCTIVPWMRNRRIYFFLDDYSLPHISEKMQETLHDCILFRWHSCFFKVSTESITSLHPFDASGKLLEETREYSVVDLGAYFFNAPTRRRQFITEVVNNRLKQALTIHSEYHDISTVLGPKPWPTYNALALRIRSGKGKVQYAGIETIVDIFSGDIANILNLIRNMFFNVGPYDSFAKPGLKLPLRPDLQNHALRDYASTFVERIGYAPVTGAKLVKVANAFGQAANWLLKNRNSQNQNKNPPWQTFRIMVRNSFSFDDLEVFRPVYDKTIPITKRHTYPLEAFVKDCKTLYNDLLKYAIFLRDARGKSARGAVVPRLYLRRLLLPLYVLTPNQRDSIHLEVEEFISLLVAPERFQKVARRKHAGLNSTQEVLSFGET